MGDLFPCLYLLILICMPWTLPIDIMGYSAYSLPILSSPTHISLYLIIPFTLFHDLHLVCACNDPALAMVASYEIITTFNTLHLTVRLLNQTRPEDRGCGWREPRSTCSLSVDGSLRRHYLRGVRARCSNSLRHPLLARTYALAFPTGSARQQRK